MNEPLKDMASAQNLRYHQVFIGREDEIGQLQACGAMPDKALVMVMGELARQDGFVNNWRLLLFKVV
jgi:hypothetical protein